MKPRVFAILLLTAVALFAAWAPSSALQRYLDEVFADVAVTHDIAYGAAIDEYGEVETLYLDLYQPAGDTEPERPAFVWIHGGGFTAGDKADSNAAEIATRFAKRGYVTTSINYRLREGEYFEPGDPDLPLVILEAQHDAQASVRWLRANAAAYHIDPERIAVGGSSAGAITSLFVNYNSGDPGDSGNPGYPSNTSAVVDVSGGMGVALIDAGEPPVLVVHGEEDTRVPYSMALDIVARCQEVGVVMEFHSLPGVGHLLWATEYKEPIIGWMSEFLYREVAAPPIGGFAEPSGETGGNEGEESEGLAIALLIAGIVLAAGAIVIRIHHRSFRSP